MFTTIILRRIVVD